MKDLRERWEEERRVEVVVGEIKRADWAASLNPKGFIFVIRFF